MPEKIVVLQNDKFETVFWAPDPWEPESDTFRPVEQIGALTPHSMLLASLGASTATDLHTYAQKHGLDLQDVELRLQYGRLFAADRESYADNGNGAGQIEEEIVLYGELSSAEHDTLIDIAQQCSISKMLNYGTAVTSLPAQDW